MKKVKLLAAVFLAGIFALAFAAIPAGATANTKLSMVQDCGAGCSEPIDMEGPAGFGFVNYNQDDEGNLRVVTSLKNAEPNTTYSVFLVCGPTHATACGFIEIGTLTTNGQGHGNTSAIVVEESVLQSAPFGVGDRTDHIDLLKSGGDNSAGVYAVSDVNYVVEP